MSQGLFLDTGVLIARINPKDDYHDDALRFWNTISEGRWSQVYTSDFVITEGLNYLRRKIPVLEAAETFLTPLLGTEQVRPAVSSILRIHSGRFARALHLFQERFDQGLSMTDWTNLVCMEEQGIAAIATTDGGFEGLVDEVHLLERA